MPAIGIVFPRKTGNIRKERDDTDRLFCHGNGNPLSKGSPRKGIPLYSSLRPLKARLRRLGVSSINPHPSSGRLPAARAKHTALQPGPPLLATLEGARTPHRGRHPRPPEAPLPSSRRCQDGPVPTDGGSHPPREPPRPPSAPGSPRPHPTRGGGAPPGDSFRVPHRRRLHQPGGSSASSPPPPPPRASSAAPAPASPAWPSADPPGPFPSRPAEQRAPRPRLGPGRKDAGVGSSPGATLRAAPQPVP